MREEPKWKEKKERSKKKRIRRGKKKEFIEREGKEKRKGKGKGKMEDFPVLRRSKLDGSSTKVLVHAARSTCGHQKLGVLTNSIR